ncbi:MAG: molybdopterin cofactor-binding domain-containing protein, partial [Niameybacter sp.]
LHIEDGKVHTRTSAACIGQGLSTVMTQMICETTNLSPTLIIHDPPDTLRTPDSGNTTASRQTLFTGEAVHQAARALANDLKRHTLSMLEGKVYYGEYIGLTDSLGSDKKNPVSHIAYGYATHL